MRQESPASDIGCACGCVTCELLFAVLCKLMLLLKKTKTTKTTKTTTTNDVTLTCLHACMQHQQQQQQHQHNNHNNNNNDNHHQQPYSHRGQTTKKKTSVSKYLSGFGRLRHKTVQSSVDACSVRTTTGTIISTIMDNPEPIYFHSVCGENIELRSDRRVAARKESFNKAICFTSRPLKANEKLRICITSTLRSWTGTLRIGVTVHDPVTFEGNLPKYCCPDLNLKPGNWARALEEQYTAQGTILQIYCVDNKLMLQANEGEPQAFICGLETKRPLYGLFDVYGNTGSIELLSPPARSELIQVAATAAPAAPLPVPEVRPISKSFENVQLRPAIFCPLDTTAVTSSLHIAYGKKGTEGGLAIMSTPLAAGEALIVRLRDLYREQPIRIALAAVEPSDILDCWSMSELCADTYSLQFQSGLTTADEELAIVLSEEGEVHVSHAGTKWLKTVHVDPNVPYYVVFDMQHIRKLQCVGITSQLQAPSGSLGGDALRDCVVCLNNTRDTLITPCNHFVLCESCAYEIKEVRKEPCPICRKAIRECKRIFMA